MIKKQLPSAFQRTVFESYARLRPYLREPPGADPHAGWLWGLGVKISRLPDYNFIFSFITFPIASPMFLNSSDEKTSDFALLHQ
jgi:hypothetical protein